MYRVDHATNTGTLPAPTDPGPNPDGFYEDKDPGGGIEGTVVQAEHLNMIQEEICAVIEDSGLTLDKGDRTQLLQALQTMIGAAGGLPSGVIQAYGGLSVPSGWLLCSGQAVNRITYADLFDAIGTTFGAGNGTTTFNVPDLRGRYPMGADNMGGSSANRVTAATADTIGQSGGEENHTLTVDEMPSHNHGTVRTGIADRSGGGGQCTFVTDTAMPNAGGDDPHNNMPPYLTLNYIIKT